MTNVISPIKNRCQRCEQILNPGKEVWLELDQRTNTYTDEGTVPAEFTQGAFPFGPDCARHAKQDHKWTTEGTIDRDHFNRSKDLSI